MVITADTKTVEVSVGPCLYASMQSDTIDTPLHAPYVIKMARTKRSACRGRMLNRLDDLIAAAERTDAVWLSINSDRDRPAWDAAYEAAQAAAAELLAFAGPIVPRQDAA